MSNVYIILSAIFSGMITGGLVIRFIFLKKIKRLLEHIHALNAALEKAEQAAVADQTTHTRAHLQLTREFDSLQQELGALKSKYNELYRNHIQVTNEKNRLKSLLDNPAT